MLMAATASSSTVLRPTPFLGQTRGANSNSLRDVVPMGAGKYTMVKTYLPSQSLVLYVYVCVTEMGGCFFGCEGKRSVVWS